jgi:hypothetical protein
MSQFFYKIVLFGSLFLLVACSSVNYQRGHSPITSPISNSLRYQETGLQAGTVLYSHPEKTQASDSSNDIRVDRDHFNLQYEWLNSYRADTNNFTQQIGFGISAGDAGGITSFIWGINFFPKRNHTLAFVAKPGVILGFKHHIEATKSSFMSSTEVTEKDYLRFGWNSILGVNYVYSASDYLSFDVEYQSELGYLTHSSYVADLLRMAVTYGKSERLAAGVLLNYREEESIKTNFNPGAYIQYLWVNRLDKEEALRIDSLYDLNSIRLKRHQDRMADSLKKRSYGLYSSVDMGLAWQENQLFLSKSYNYASLTQDSSVRHSYSQPNMQFNLKTGYFIPSGLALFVKVGLDGMKSLEQDPLLEKTSQASFGAGIALKRESFIVELEKNVKSIHVGETNVNLSGLSALVAFRLGTLIHLNWGLYGSINSTEGTTTDVNYGRKLASYSQNAYSLGFKIW